MENLNYKMIDSIKSMPDYMLQTKINGQSTNENNDATLIAFTAVLLSVSSFIIVQSFLKYLVILIFVIMLFKYITSFYKVYIKFDKKYLGSEGYVARKFETAALPYFIYAMIIPYIIYDSSFLWIALFFLPYAFSQPLVNILWRNFDTLKYQQLDNLTTYQKRSFFETEEASKLYFECKKELVVRELNRHRHATRDLSDIEIKTKQGNYDL